MILFERKQNLIGYTHQFLFFVGWVTNCCPGDVLKLERAHERDIFFADTSLHPELVESPRSRRAFTDVTTEKQRLRRNRAFRQDSAAVFNVHVHGQVRRSIPVCCVITITCLCKEICTCHNGLRSV